MMIGLENNYALQNIVISALRYALPRHTYIVSETCDFIMEHGALLDERVINVMLRDIEVALSCPNRLYECDIEKIEQLKKFLEVRLRMYGYDRN